VAFTLVGQEGLTYPQAMGVIVAEGVLITILVLAGVRKYVMDAVPLELKKGISVGIGLFILFIGLVNGGIISTGEGTIVGLTDLRGAPVLVTAFGLFLTIGLLAMKQRAAILIGIVATTIFAIIVEQIGDTGQFVPGQAQIPDSILATPDFSVIGDISFGFFAELGLSVAILTILAIMLADFFDTMGTLVGVGSQAGYLNEKGELPDAQKALLVDSLGAVAGGAASSSSATTYIESASGVANGGRTGLVAVTVGVLFLLAMPFFRHRRGLDRRWLDDDQRAVRTRGCVVRRPHGALQGGGLQRHRGRLAGAGHHDDDAADLQHHQRHWRRVHRLDGYQDVPWQVRGNSPRHVRHHRGVHYLLPALVSGGRCVRRKTIINPMKN
jgi:hypothetical protein